MNTLTKTFSCEDKSDDTDHARRNEMEFITFFRKTSQILIWFLFEFYIINCKDTLIENIHTEYD